MLRVVVFILVTVVSLRASASELIETDVCTLQTQPKQYAGQMVKFAAVWSRTPRRILVDGPNGKCGPILVQLPSDPDVRPRAHFKVVEDAELNRFLQSGFVLIPNAESHKTGHIGATLQGRFDVAAPGKGFGHGHLYNLRLVLQRVSEVSVEAGGQAAARTSPN